MQMQSEAADCARSHRIDLRDATVRDAAALAALNVASWRAAYAHMSTRLWFCGGVRQ